MSKVAVVTDSTAYIPQELLAGYPIRVAPLQVLWDGESYRDGVDILPKEFYTRLAGSKTMPSTSQTTPGWFQEIYAPLLDDGYDIVSIHISATLSGTVDSALQARAELKAVDRIAVIDSRSAGMALGFQALAVARAANNGASLAECVKLAQKAVGHTGVLFVVDTLEFLHRGGRIGGGQAFLGKLLDVKPILTLRDGKIEPADKTRTKNRAIERMVNLLKNDVGDRRPVRIAALHANVPDQAEKLLEHVCQCFNSSDIAEAMSADVSPVIGTHIGPGGLGLAYMAGM